MEDSNNYTVVRSGNALTTYKDGKFYGVRESASGAQHVWFLPQSPPNQEFEKMKEELLKSWLKDI